MGWLTVSSFAKENGYQMMELGVGGGSPAPASHLLYCWLLGTAARELCICNVHVACPNTHCPWKTSSTATWDEAECHARMMFKRCWRVKDKTRHVKGPHANRGTGTRLSQGGWEQGVGTLAVVEVTGVSCKGCKWSLGVWKRVCQVAWATVMRLVIQANLGEESINFL